MASGSKVKCRKKVDTPWSIYRDFAVCQKSVLVLITSKEKEVVIATSNHIEY